MFGKISGCLYLLQCIAVFFYFSKNEKRFADEAIEKNTSNMRTFTLFSAKHVFKVVVLRPCVVFH